MAYPQPNIIPHPPNDHRHVEASELLSLKFYNNYMFKPFSDIIDYVVLPNFLKSTSKWTEAHLTAFRCLRLENLPESRIVPLSEMPGDEDPRMKLVIEHLLATEDDIRSGAAELVFGPATTFYTQLQVVLRRPQSPPDPILIPRSVRPSTLSTVFPPIPESQGSTSDESYQQSPPKTVQARLPSPMGDIEESTRTNRDSLDSQRSGEAKSSFEEDKLEDAPNEAAVAFLELLCSFHWSAFKDSQTRIRFSREPMQPALVIHGQVVRSYNDGSFYIERRSARRPRDWVSQDSYPRASLECKRKRHTRKELIHAQELGEILAIGHNRYVNNKWEEKDREVYLIGLHHDRMYVIAAEFPQAYFLWVQDDQIPLGGCLVMRQSSSFDLSKPEPRKEACRLIFTVLQRIMK